MLTYGKGWEKSVTYAEFSNSNNYQPLMWLVRGRCLVEPALIKKAEEHAAKLRETLKAAQCDQKSYSNK